MAKSSQRANRLTMVSSMIRIALQVWRRTAGFGGRMSVVFDAAWFDARLAERGQDRHGLAAAANLTPADLDVLFASGRAPAPGELKAFAGFLNLNLAEVTQHGCQAAAVAEAGGDGASTRIDNIEARLDALDQWLAEFEGSKKSA
jgi:hypothetical protein